MEETSTDISFSGSIETTRQFLSWFTQVEKDIERSQEDIYRLVAYPNKQRINF